MEIIFHSHAIKTHFHKKGCVLSLILKVRVFGTRKWPIVQAEKVYFAGREYFPLPRGGARAHFAQ